MGKLIVLLSMLLLISCFSPEREIREYLEENVPVLTSLEIINVSGLDSVYNPYRDIREAHLKSVQYSTGVLEALNSYEGTHYRERADFVQDSLRPDLDEIMAIILNVERALNFKSLNNDYIAPMNSTGMKAKIRLNDLLREEIFYTDNKKVTGSSIEASIKYHEVGQVLDDVRENIRFYRQGY